MTTTQNTMPASQVRAVSALATLNMFRQAAGKAPLKVWKASRKELDAAIAKAQGDAPIGSKLPDVPAKAVIAKINEQKAQPILDAENLIVKLSADDRKQAWADQPPRASSFALKSVAIAKTVTPEQEKIMSANKSQGKKKPSGERARYDWVEAEIKAKAGKLPIVPDFSANTHRYYRPKLAEVVKMAKAGDVKGLRAFKINGESTSPTAIKRYVKFALVAIAAGAKG